MFPVLRSAIAGLALLAICLVSPAIADPAGRVGRVSVLDGPTLYRVDRADAGAPASVNWPVSSGAIFDTERGSRAEIWVGSTAFRLAGETRLEFSIVDDRQLLAQLATGTLALVIRDGEQAAELELVLPNGRVRFGEPGSYRVDVGPGFSRVAVHAGSAVVDAGNGSAQVGAGRSAELDDGGGLALHGASARDDVDAWSASRDAATQAPAARRYVSPQMTGYQDLDAYGDWATAADYGSIWYPHATPAGWAPYRYGRWAWLDPWGWTWVDAAPWGFAPFHYGRWVEVRGRWGWVPGSYVARPLYAPALVAWVGNPGWSVSLSVGRTPAVGWFPLAPREVYVPAYRASTTYVRRLNVTHIGDAAAVERALSARGERRFAYRASPRAVTVVPLGTMRQGRAVAPSALPVREPRDLRRAPYSARAPGSDWLAPERISRPPSRPATPPGERERRVPPRVPLLPGSVAPTPFLDGNEGGWRTPDSPRREARAGEVPLRPAELRPAPGRVERPPTAIERPPTAIERPPTVIERPPTAIERPPTVIERPPAVIERPPAVIERPPIAAERSPTPIERPPTVDRRAFPPAAERPPVQAPVDRAPPIVRELPRQREASPPGLPLLTPLPSREAQERARPPAEVRPLPIVRPEGQAQRRERRGDGDRP